jgi:hypothetical protein
LFGDTRWEQIKGGNKYKRWGDYTINVNEVGHEPFLKLPAGKYMIKSKIIF